MVSIFEVVGDVVVIVVVVFKLAGSTASKLEQLEFSSHDDDLRLELDASKRSSLMLNVGFRVISN